MDVRKSQTSTASPAKPGGLLCWASWSWNRRREVITQAECESRAADTRKLTADENVCGGLGSPCSAIDVRPREALGGVSRDTRVWRPGERRWKYHDWANLGQLLTTTPFSGWLSFNSSVPSVSGRRHRPVGASRRGAPSSTSCGAGPLPTIYAQRMFSDNSFLNSKLGS